MVVGAEHIVPESQFHVILFLESSCGFAKEADVGGMGHRSEKCLSFRKRKKALVWLEIFIVNLWILAGNFTCSYLNCAGIIGLCCRDGHWSKCCWPNVHFTVAFYQITFLLIAWLLVAHV